MSYIGANAQGIISSIDGGTIKNATLDSSVSLPSFVGMIASFAMSSAPTGWLVCNGAAYAIADYGDLYGVIGTTWGALQDDSGNPGTTHFRVPDLQGAFLRGSGNGTINARTKAGGSVGSLVEDQMQLLTGDASYISGGSSANIGVQSGVFSGTGARYTISYANGADPRFHIDLDFDSSNSPNARTSSTTSGETFPYNATVLYCIRY